MKKTFVIYNNNKCFGIRVDVDADDLQLEVKVLGEEDVAKYTMHDVVLPLPGFEIRYPDNISLHS